MSFFSIHGQKARDLRKEVENNYDKFWRPILQLIKLGYLTYTEAMEITEDDLYKLWQAVEMIEES